MVSVLGDDDGRFDRWLDRVNFSKKTCTYDNVVNDNK